MHCLWHCIYTKNIKNYHKIIIKLWFFNVLSLRLSCKVLPEILWKSRDQCFFPVGTARTNRLTQIVCKLFRLYTSCSVLSGISTGFLSILAWTKRSICKKNIDVVNISDRISYPESIAWLNFKLWSFWKIFIDDQESLGDKGKRQGSETRNTCIVHTKYTTIQLWCSRNTRQLGLQVASVAVQLKDLCSGYQRTQAIVVSIAQPPDTMHSLSRHVYLRETHRKKGRNSQMDRKSMVSKGRAIATTVASFLFEK